MASPAQRELCCALVKQYFGDIVESVCRALFSFDQATVSQLCFFTKLHHLNVKKSLIILIKHQLIECSRQNSYTEHFEYEILPTKILAFFRHAKYIAQARSKYGEEAGIIIKNLIANGHIKLSNLIHSTWEHVLRETKDLTAEEAKKLLLSIHSKSQLLIKEHYIKRIDLKINKIQLDLKKEKTLSKKAYSLGEDVDLNLYLYDTKDINLNLYLEQLLKMKGFDMISQLMRMNKSTEVNNVVFKEEPSDGVDLKPNIKKFKLENDNQNGTEVNQQNSSDLLTCNPDNGIYWQLNIDRFNRDIRDEFVIGAVIKHYGDDSKTGLICQALLELSKNFTNDQAPITSPISFDELYTHLSSKFPVFKERPELESYLKTLDSDTNNRFIFNNGFRIGRGNMYSVNVGKVLDRLVRELLGTIVSCRFGPKCCRIFRLLMSKKYLLSKQIEDSVMLPTRDVREYTYMLIKEGLVRNLQIPRTADYAPSKSLFVMGVEIDQVVLSIIDRCCKSMNNTILRHDHETGESKQLLDRAKAVQNLIKTGKVDEHGMDTGDSLEQPDIWDEYFSAHERQQLDLIKKRLNTLELSRLQIDDTLHQLLLWMDIWPNMQTSVES